MQIKCIALTLSSPHKAFDWEISIDLLVLNISKLTLFCYLNSRSIINEIIYVNESKVRALSISTFQIGFFHLDFLIWYWDFVSSFLYFWGLFPQKFLKIFWFINFNQKPIDNSYRSIWNWFEILRPLLSESAIFCSCHLSSVTAVGGGVK